MKNYIFIDSKGKEYRLTKEDILNCFEKNHIQQNYHGRIFIESITFNGTFLRRKLEGWRYIVQKILLLILGLWKLNKNLYKID